MEQKKADDGKMTLGNVNEYPTKMKGNNSAIRIVQLSRQSAVGENEPCSSFTASVLAFTDNNLLPCFQMEPTNILVKWGDESLILEVKQMVHLI